MFLGGGCASLEGLAADAWKDTPPSCLAQLRRREGEGEGGRGWVERGGLEGGRGGLRRAGRRVRADGRLL